jgi:hypothetical protein
MKTILCFGDSNTLGARPLTSLDNIPRYGPDIRWGGVLRTTWERILCRRRRLERPHNCLARIV